MADITRCTDKSDYFQSLISPPIIKPNMAPIITGKQVEEHWILIKQQHTGLLTTVKPPNNRVGVHSSFDRVGSYKATTLKSEDLNGFCTFKTYNL